MKYPEAPAKGDQHAPVEEERENLIERFGRYWAVYDLNGKLVCLAVYRKGAEEVRRRLLLLEKAG